MEDSDGQETKDKRQRRPPRRFCKKHMFSDEKIQGSGTIDFDEFVDIFARKVTMDPEAELKEVFRVFDSDHDGFISPAELYGVLSRLGEKITRQEAEEMVKEADLNGDGKVDYSEFRAILSSR
ncbi:hypothetical protein C0Q70_18882 [Pomacea canaliculata]|uniref:EF-hand domain-containing protein n=1 Tax=Pomacea canaliculata TaxID=400727 RepID=A0A2T7NHV3_POMCA|nr:hypothetical protein C0Q70_18882 [Pomacea canaliculata]